MGLCSGLHRAVSGWFCMCVQAPRRLSQAALNCLCGFSEEFLWWAGSRRWWLLFMLALYQWRCSGMSSWVVGHFLNCCSPADLWVPNSGNLKVFATSAWAYLHNHCAKLLLKERKSEGVALMRVLWCAVHTCICLQPPSPSASGPKCVHTLPPPL